ncbi:hypothetical protein NVP1215B_020 [Vibrio phage 1.215.B._10N.222.54.F7]|nr:hypothetical protein NVP1215A_020 [Vibrio phage 1.215.A._10N.222.54.F7]AUR96043.1 hypothetical protein NVP1215B_020 [Vibrio phage 1.215.B._10N.222.54.F7]
MNNNPVDFAILSMITSASNFAKSANKLAEHSTLADSEVKKLCEALRALDHLDDTLTERLTKEPEAANVVNPDPTAKVKQVKNLNEPNEMIRIKRSNEHATLKSIINCPTCNTDIVKERYNTNFCSNKGNGNCKDGFYQATNPDRRKAVKS